MPPTTMAKPVVPPVSSTPNAGSSKTSPGSVAPVKAAKLVPFLRKVQVLCETAPPHIARWSADGKQFDVLDPKGFDQLLRIHFEGANPATFHRQLFFYGWVKLNYSNGGGDEKTKGTWSFRHPSFLRDEPSRIYEIKRYARASDREEQEDGSRVDVLERRVSALQSLVDDLSRKLAAVQMTLERAPLPVEQTKQPEGRKRLRDLDEDFLSEDFRLSEDEILSLFEDPNPPQQFLAQVPMATQPKEVPLDVVKMDVVKQKENVDVVKPKKEHSSQQQAQNFLSSFMSTPQFQVALTSTIQENTTNVASSQKKVEALPHLSVW